MADVATVPAAQSGLWESIKNFDVNGITQAIKAYPFDWVEIGSMVGVGLLSGFLVKRYFRTFVMAVVVGVVLLAVLDKCNLVHIDWTQVQSMVGIQPTKEAFTNLFQGAYAWMCMNLQVVISFGVGFIIGYKIS